MATERDPSITEDEYELLLKLREAVQDLFQDLEKDSKEFKALDKHINTDFRLVRYIRARNHNLAKAEKHVRSAMEWRLEMDLDSKLEGEAPPEWLLQYYGSPEFAELANDFSLDRLGWYLRDKDHGNLAVIARTGISNDRAIFKKLGNSEEVLIGHILWACELFQQDMDRMHIESNGKILSQLTAVLDLSDFKMSQQIHFTNLVRLARTYLPKVLLCYPEILHRVCIINAPFVWYSLWNAVQPLLPQRVKDKIKINGHRNNLSHIEKFIDKSEIPASYGGDLIINDDEKCIQRIPCSGPFREDEGKSLLAIDV